MMVHYGESSGRELPEVGLCGDAIIANRWTTAYDDVTCLRCLANLLVAHAELTRRLTMLLQRESREQDQRERW